MPCSPSQWINSGTRWRAASELGLEMIPAVLTVGIQEKFLVAFGAQNRAIHHGGFESEFLHGLGHPFACGPVQFRRAHNSALADLALPHFKLRLDQYNHLPAIL